MLDLIANTRETLNGLPKKRKGSSNSTKNQDHHGLHLLIISRTSKYLFKFRSQNCIKNKFYNNLRRACRKIEDHQKHFFKTCRSHVGYDSISIILDIFFQIQRWNRDNGFKCNQQSKIWLYKEKILQMTFMSTDLYD